MNWLKVLAKTAKHAAITGGAAAAATLQAMPPGSEIDWQAVAVQAALAAVLGGATGGGLNAWKHREISLVR